MVRPVVVIQVSIGLTVGLVLLIGTILWSTGRLELPYPFASLRSVPEGGLARTTGTFSLPTGQDRGLGFRRRLVASILRDGMVTVTIHVALCDSSKSKVTSPELGLGQNPAKNLYWGAKNGMERFFQDRREWRHVGADLGRSDRRVLKRVVFLRQIKPTPDWRQRGVTQPFMICILAVAWAGPAAEVAMEAVFKDALNLRPPTVITVGDKTLRFGSGSDLVGYAGFNAAKENPKILPNPGDVPAKPEPRGVFFITPDSAETIGPTLQQLGLHPVLLTTGTITPEAYILYGLTEALASGQIERGFTTMAAKQYARYQKLKPEEAYKLFVP